MVKKLFKHEFKHYLKFFIPIELIVVCTAIILGILNIFSFDNVFYGISLYSTWVIFSVAAFASVFITAILAVVRFYKNLYTAEGYLTFTLPVSIRDHFLVKLFTAAVFEAASLFIAVISFCVAATPEFMIELYKAVDYVFADAVKELSVHFYLYLFEILIVCCISAFSGLLVWYTCISIGQLSKKNRILMAFVWYFVYYFVMQILSTVFTVGISVTFAFIDISAFEEFIKQNIEWIIHGVLGIIALISAGFNIGLCFANKKIMTDKLNLE